MSNQSMDSLPIEILELILNYLSPEDRYILLYSLNNKKYISQSLIPTSLIFKYFFQYSDVKTIIDRSGLINIPESVEYYSIKYHKLDRYDSDWNATLMITIQRAQRLRHLSITSYDRNKIDTLICPDSPLFSLKYLNISVLHVSINSPFFYIFSHLEYFEMTIDSAMIDVLRMVKSLNHCNHLNTFILKYSGFRYYEYNCIGYILENAPDTLKRLELHSFTNKNAPSSIKVKCTQLETLIIKTDTISSVLAETICSMKKLVEIDISFRESMKDAMFGKIFSDLPELKSMKIIGEMIINDPLIIDLPELEKLSLKVEPYYQSKEYTIEEIKCPKLVSLEVPQYKIKTSDQFKNLQIVNSIRFPPIYIPSFSLIVSLSCTLDLKQQEYIPFMANLSELKINVVEVSQKLMNDISRLKKLNYVNIKHEKSTSIKNATISREMAPDRNTNYIRNANGKKVEKTMIFKILNNNEIKKLIEIFNQFDMDYNINFGKKSGIEEIFQPHEFIQNIVFLIDSVNQTYELLEVIYEKDAYLYNSFVENLVNTIDLTMEDIMNISGRDYVSFMLNDGFRLHSSFYSTSWSNARNIVNYLEYSVWKRDLSFVFIKVNWWNDIISINSILY